MALPSLSGLSLRAAAAAPVGAPFDAMRLGVKETRQEVQKRVNAIHDPNSTVEDRARAVKDLLTNMHVYDTTVEDIKRFAKALPAGVVPYKPIFDLLSSADLNVAKVALSFFLEIGAIFAIVDYGIDYAPELAGLMSIGDSQTTTQATTLLNEALENSPRHVEALIDAGTMAAILDALPKLVPGDDMMVFDWLEHAAVHRLVRSSRSAEERARDAHLHRVILEADGFNAILKFTMRNPRRPSSFRGISFLKSLVAYQQNDNAGLAFVQRITRESANWDRKQYPSPMRLNIAELLTLMCEEHGTSCDKTIARDTPFFRLLVRESVRTPTDALERDTQKAMKDLLELLTQRGTMWIRLLRALWSNQDPGTVAMYAPTLVDLMGALNSSGHVYDAIVKYDQRQRRRGPGGSLISIVVDLHPEMRKIAAFADHNPSALAAVHLLEGYTEQLKKTNVPTQEDERLEAEVRRDPQPKTFHVTPDQKRKMREWREFQEFAEKVLKEYPVLPKKVNEDARAYEERLRAAESREGTTPNARMLAQGVIEELWKPKHEAGAHASGVARWTLPHLIRSMFAMSRVAGDMDALMLDHLDSLKRDEEQMEQEADEVNEVNEGKRKRARIQSALRDALMVHFDAAHVDATLARFYGLERTP